MSAYDDLIPKGAGSNPYADLIPKKAEMGAASLADAGIPQHSNRRDPATYAPGTPSWKRAAPVPATKDEAIAAAARYALDDEALAAVLRPDAPDAVTGLEIQDARVKDYDIAKGYIGNAKILKKLGTPALTPALLRTAAATDATATAEAPVQAAQAVPEPVLSPKPVTTDIAPSDASAAPKAIEAPQAPVPPEEAKLYERAQSLAEAIPSFAKGAVKGATAGIVDPTKGTEGAPGALGQVAGNLAGGFASGLAGPAGPPAFMMAQFLNDLQDRGMDPAKLTDPEVLALAATSGLFGGLTPVAFGEKALTRALTGAAIGAGQNVAEEDIIAAVTDTEPERLRAAILGGAFGAGFGAAFKHNPKVREAVEAKLPESDVKALDAVVEKVVPDEAAVTVAEEVAPAGVKVPDAPAPTEAAAAEPATAKPAEPAAAEVPELPAQAPELEAKLGEMVPVEVPEQATVISPETQARIAEKNPTADYSVAEDILDRINSGGSLAGGTTSSGEVTVGHGQTPYESGRSTSILVDLTKAERKDLARAEADLELSDGGAERIDARARIQEILKAAVLREINPEAPPEGAAAPATPAAPAKSEAPPDASPTKPFGETPEGIVRAPHEDEANTSARKAYTTRDREQMGLDEIPSPERRKWQEALDEAHDRGLSAEAETLAKTIIEKPRALTDVETAGMVRRMAELKNQHEAALDKLSTLTEPDAINEQSRALKDIEDKFDIVSRAVRYSGTEKGRNLASQKLTINKSYDLIHVLNRAKAKRGAELPPAERAKFEEMTKTLKETESRLADAETRIRDLRARDAIKERRTSSKRKPEEVKVTLADLTEKTRRLLRAGCLTS